MSVNIKDSSSKNGLRRVAGRGRSGSDVTKVSQLENDSKYQTEEDVSNRLQGYALKTDIPNLEVLSKFSVDESGNLLYDGRAIGTGGSGTISGIVAADETDLDPIFDKQEDK